MAAGAATPAASITPMRTVRRTERASILPSRSRRRVNLGFQLAPQRIEIIASHQFRHDELPRSFGVRLCLVLRYADIPQVLGIAEGVKSERYPDRSGPLASICQRRIIRRDPCDRGSL